MSTKNLQITDRDLRVNFQQGTKNFPIQYYVDELSRYPNKLVPLHWHPELELYRVFKGCVEIQLDNNIITLNSGDGLLINSNVLHSSKQIGDENCICPNITFSSEMIAPPSTIIYEKYMSPILLDKRLPYIALFEKVEWQKNVLDNLDCIFSLMQKYSSASAFYGPFRLLPFPSENISSDCYEMQVQSLLNGIWQTIYSNNDSIERKGDTRNKQVTQIRTQKMLEFIYQNYEKQITLKDIARSADISKSEATRCFDCYLHVSPVNFLINYRIERAKELLRQTESSVAEIAYACGVSSPSYFGKLFLKITGTTAGQYRKTL